MDGLLVLLMIFSFLVLGLLFLLLSANGLWNYARSEPTGLPLTQISPGVYKVGFVYQAGGNVSVGIEKEGKEAEVKSTEGGIEKADKYKVEHLFLYQLPVEDFEGLIWPDAKKLTVYKVVTGNGTFNRYKLE
jgi:hypothetical protein